MKFLVTQTPQNFIKSMNEELSSIMNRHFDNYFPDRNYWTNMSDNFTIPIELEDKGKNYELLAQVPGIKKEAIDIDIEDNYMTISAKTSKEEKEENNNIKKSEFHYGSFSRTICFPEDVDTEKINAKLQDGILKIEIGKKEEKKDEKKKITIQ